MLLQQNESKLFVWHSFDVRSILPTDWQEDVMRAASKAVVRELVPTSVTSREADRAQSIPTRSLDGVAIVQELPWLHDLYHGYFSDLAQLLVSEPVTTSSNRQSGIILNVQQGTDKAGYECHVDSNPLQGLLYATSHPEGAGGELVVANRGDVPSRDEVNASATRIYPVAGHLVFFNARQHSHYVSPLADPAGTRAAVAMTYYVPSCPESGRPADLDTHLFDKP